MNDSILQVKGLSKIYNNKTGSIKAVNDVSFMVTKGKTLGVVGESGCGKSTLGKSIVNAHQSTEGSMIYTRADGNSVELFGIDNNALKDIRKEIQMIFQDPYSSLNPRMTVFDIISEPLKANTKMSQKEMKQRVTDVAEKVGLNTSFLMRYPHAFSGGQRQRIGIARAIVLYPQLIVCDEAVSALDVSVQAQVINLLKKIQKEFGLTYIFISHDLSVVEFISDQVMVMYLGKMVEFSNTKDLFMQPYHPYTEALLSAVPIANPNNQTERIYLQGELPNPMNPPKGCCFNTRCRYVVKECMEREPELEEVIKGHFTACHRAKELKLKGIIQK